MLYSINNIKAFLLSKVTWLYIVRNDVYILLTDAMTHHQVYTVSLKDVVLCISCVLFCNLMHRRLCTVITEVFLSA